MGLLPNNELGLIDWRATSNVLAHDVLSMAASGEMPDTFWQTDQRVLRACEALDISPENARNWAQENAPRRM